VRDLLKAFANLAHCVITLDAMHTQAGTAQVILGRHADYVMTVKGNMPTLYRQLKNLPWARIPAVSSVSTENKLHWVRDVTYQEDKSLVRTGNAPHVMATGSLAIGLLCLDGQANIAAANRHHARDPQRTLNLLQAP
jgi:predicted transposase YbfD/YdcC